jgi:hypothetical protein
MTSLHAETMADAANLRYLCKTCKAMFWSYNDVVLHKGTTGHGEYETSPRNKPYSGTQSEA